MLVTIKWGDICGCDLFFMYRDGDRAMGMGLDPSEKPKVWRVYSRRNRGVKKGVEVAEVASQVTEFPKE